MGTELGAEVRLRTFRGSTREVGGPHRPLVPGLVVWASTLALLPAPMSARILLLAPLVITPTLLNLLPRRRFMPPGGWPAFLAALPLVIAFASPAGPITALFAIPWSVFASAAAMAAVAHGVAHRSAIVDPRRWADLGVDVALGFWAVAAGFTVLDRLGVDTGFAPAIVLLTATHFHFAGLALLAVASLLARSRRWLRVPVAGLMIGISVTAVGFVLVSDAVKAVGALFVGLSGIGVGIGLLTAGAAGAARWAMRIAGTTLSIGMAMGIAWSLAIVAGTSFLDLDTMVRTHGVLNATAVLLAVVSYRSDPS